MASMLTVRTRHMLHVHSHFRWVSVVLLGLIIQSVWLVAREPLKALMVLQGRRLMMAGGQAGTVPDHADQTGPLLADQYYQYQCDLRR